MLVQDHKISWLLDSVRCVCMALSERAAELVVRWFRGKCCGYRFDHGSRDDISFCLRLGTQDEEGKDSDERCCLSRSEGLSLDKLSAILQPKCSSYYVHQCPNPLTHPDQKNRHEQY